MATERIRQIKKEKEEAERERIAKLKKEKELESIEAEIGQLPRTDDIEEAAEERQKAIKFMIESGAIKELNDIGNEFLGEFHHNLMQSDASIMLVWGRYRIVKGELTYRFGLMDYFHIDTNFEADSVTIKGATTKTIKRNEWEKDKTTLTNAFAEAFLHPGHVNRKPPSGMTRDPGPYGFGRETN